jgi:hypothetical protein
MDRTSGYLFAQHALEFPDDFPDAPQKLELIKDWISQWSQKIFRYGTGEWNSSTYQTYHINGWLNLYDFATILMYKKWQEQFWIIMRQKWHFITAGVPTEGAKSGAGVPLT